MRNLAPNHFTLIVPSLSNLETITFTAKHTNPEYLPRRVQEALLSVYPGHPPTSYPNLNLFILMSNQRSCRLHSTDFFVEHAFTTKVSISFLSPPLPHATISWYPYLGDNNEFTRIHQSSLPHLRKVSIQLELRSLSAMSENALLSVASLHHSNKIATLSRLGELAFSCSGADIDLDARAHQLSGKSI